MRLCVDGEGSCLSAGRSRRVPSAARGTHRASSGSVARRIACPWCVSSTCRTPVARSASCASTAESAPIQQPSPQGPLRNAAHGFLLIAGSRQRLHAVPCDRSASYGTRQVDLGAAVASFCLQPHFAESGHHCVAVQCHFVRHEIQPHSGRDDKPGHTLGDC